MTPMSFSVTRSYSGFPVEVSQSDRTRRLDSSVFHSGVRVERSVGQVHFAAAAPPPSVGLGVHTRPASFGQEADFPVGADLGWFVARHMLRHASLELLSFVDENFVVVVIFLAVYIAENVEFVEQLYIHVAQSLLRHCHYDQFLLLRT